MPTRTEMKVTNSEASSLEDSEGWGEKERKGSVEVLTAFRDVGGVSKTVLRRTELALRACCEPSRALTLTVLGGTVI